MDITRMTYKECKALFDRANQNLYAFINKEGLIITRIWATTEEEAQREYKNKGYTTKFWYIDIVG